MKNFKIVKKLLKDQKCQFDSTKVVASIKDYKEEQFDVSLTNNETTVVQDLDKIGPLATVVFTIPFQFYSSGIINVYYCSPGYYNHAISFTF